MGGASLLLGKEIRGRVDKKKDQLFVFPYLFVVSMTSPSLTFDIVERVEDNHSIPVDMLLYLRSQVSPVFLLPA